MFKGLSHVAFATGDLEKTIRFWRDLVGLRMILSLGKEGYKMYFFAVSERQYIGFFEWPGIEPIEEKEAGYPTRGRLAFDHIAIGVTAEDELWVMRDRIEAAGLWVSEVIDHGFIHSVYTFDPNGISLEFCWDTEVNLFREPYMGDQVQGAAASEGPEPQSGKWPGPETTTSDKDKKLYPGIGDFLGKDQ